MYRHLPTSIVEKHTQSLSALGILVYFLWTKEQTNNMKVVCVLIHGDFIPHAFLILQVELMLGVSYLGVQGLLHQVNFSSLS